MAKSVKDRNVTLAQQGQLPTISCTPRVLEVDIDNATAQLLDAFTWRLTCASGVPHVPDRPSYVGGRERERPRDGLCAREFVVCFDADLHLGLTSALRQHGEHFAHH